MKYVFLNITLFFLFVPNAIIVCFFYQMHSTAPKGPGPPSLTSQQLNSHLQNGRPMSEKQSSTMMPNGTLRGTLKPSRLPMTSIPAGNPLSTPTSVGEVRDILKEMTETVTPVTGIAATPRTEFDTKFAFGAAGLPQYKVPKWSQTNIQFEFY